MGVTDSGGVMLAFTIFRVAEPSFLTQKSCSTTDPYIALPKSKRVSWKTAFGASAPATAGSAANTQMKTAQKLKASFPADRSGPATASVRDYRTARRNSGSRTQKEESSPGGSR